MGLAALENRLDFVGVNYYSRYKVVAFSATHVAYSTLRMEPQYMIVGHAAGVAAKLAIDGRLAVQDVDTNALAAKLKGQRAVFEVGRP